MKPVHKRISITLMAAGMLAGLTALWAAAADRNVQQARQEEMRTVGTEMARQIGSLMRKAEGDTALISTNPVLADPSKSAAERKEEFERLARAHESFAHLSLLETRGWPLASTDADYSQRQDQTLWFMRSMEGRTVFTEPGIENVETGNPRLVFDVYQPIKPLESSASPDARGDSPHGAREKDKPVGVVRAGVRFDNIWKLLNGAPGSHRFILTNDRGKIYYHDKGELIFSELNAADFPETEDRGGTVTLDGTEYIYQRIVLPSMQTRMGREWLLYCLTPR